MVGSSGSCENCKQDLEVYCPEIIWILKTFGGYSENIVIDEHFAVLIPNSLPLHGAAPLLCAGITVYSPMMYYGLCKPRQHLGVVGLGGLGRVAVKFAKALGMKVTVISTSPSKKNEAVERLGVDSFLVAMGTMDGIINIVSGPYTLLPLINLLKTNGKLIAVGASTEAPEIPYIPLMMGRKLIGGSTTRGMKETQEMVDFAAKHNIIVDIEVIPMNYMNTAMERLAKGDTKYRFVIDVANTLYSSF
uniref:Alcohol dehydrogenase-like C-terminal domain-containing protein n=1 Tax=Quercus lobata TaxID=97700 RepID=A0A7N2MQE5_QUELO